MEEEKKTEEKVEEKTTVQDGSPEEKKSDDQPGDTGKRDEGHEDVVLFEKDGKKYTQKDLETLERKSRDFDGILEKRRIEKLLGKDEKKNEPSDDTKDEKKTFSLGEVEKLVDEKVAGVVQKIQTESFNQNFTEAYRDFIKEHPWASDDNVFDGIKKNFSSSGQSTKEGLLTRLKLAAQNAYPDQYLKIVEERAKSKVILEEREINGGDGGGGTSVKKEHEEDINSKATKEDKEIAASMGWELGRYMKYKTKEE